MIALYNTLLFEPLFNALLFIYSIIPSLGVAIILLTIIIKLILYLPSRSSLKSQKVLQQMQPKLKVIQEKYKNNKEELGRQIMKFYKDHKVSPFSSCRPLLIQLPILIALYRVFFAVAETDPETHILLAEKFEHIYGPLQETFTGLAINPMFLGMDLSQTGNWLLAILAGAAQFWSSRMLMAKRQPKVPGAKDERMTAGINKQMLYFMPLITVFFGIQFPAGLTLYWLASTLFQVGQQFYIFRKEDSDTTVVVDPK